RKTSAIPPWPIRASTRYRSPTTESLTLVPSPPEARPVRLDDLLHDRRGHPPARRLAAEGAAVDDDSGYDDAGRLIRWTGERGEPRVGRRRAVGLQPAVGRGSGLAGDRPSRDLGLRPGPALDDRDHHLLHRGRRLRRDRVAVDGVGERLDRPA